MQPAGDVLQERSFSHLIFIIKKIKKRITLHEAIEQELDKKIGVWNRSNIEFTGYPFYFFTFLTEMITISGYFSRKNC